MLLKKPRKTMKALVSITDLKPGHETCFTKQEVGSATVNQYPATFGLRVQLTCSTVY
jgi:hypothetical protein